MYGRSYVEGGMWVGGGCLNRSAIFSQANIDRHATYHLLHTTYYPRFDSIKSTASRPCLNMSWM